jgi:hypothetical protein
MIEIIKKLNINKRRGTRYIESESYGEYYFVPMIDGKELSDVAETWEMAMLIGIARKLDGPNSHFHEYAARMLKIDSDWAK